MLEEHSYSTLFSKPASQEAEVTVCISLYNYQDYIHETLSSVREQTLEILDLIVVDDRSKDDSLVVAWSWIQQNASRFNQVKLLRHESNGGLARARNTAVSQVETPNIFILDADNLLYPKCIERCLEVLENDPEAAVAYPMIEKFGDQEAVMGNVVWERSKFTKKNFVDAMALIRKDALFRAGGYSLMQVVGWEDYELWCKLIDAGLYGVMVPEILARYRTHGTSMLNSISNQRRNIKKLHIEMLELHPWLELEPL
ncbi:MAG: glycosyltransferase family 2 protein [Synechococcales cyanobacterium RM1_1_8]|nr:glycosyltransferase family 2 protein [Synechococcales cyanobacterium RM1_1_8]